MQDTSSQLADLRDSASSPQPLAWFRSQALTREYWTFFLVALFFDAGFAIYFFLFNLYLLDTHATERTIGLINGAFTIGSTVATLPAGALGRRLGVKPLLMLCLFAAPILGIGRTLFLGFFMQVVLAFAAGAAMCLWGIAYLPAVARLTNQQNRASAFSLIFCASIITSAIGGAATSFLPRWLLQSSTNPSPLHTHRYILLVSCLVAFVAVWPASRLRLDTPNATDKPANILASFRPTPFLLRFLPCMALWTAAMGAFLPFANVYLVRSGFVTMQNIGLVFSTAQCIQLFLGLVSPAIIRVIGLTRGILAMQLASALCLGGLAISRHATHAVILFLLFSGIYWMCSPALYNLLMSNVEDSQRSQAAAMVMFLNTLLLSVAVALAGASFTRFGFRLPLLSIAFVGSLVALVLRRAISPPVTGSEAAWTEDGFDIHHPTD